jgi:hypothetical protein
MACVDANADRKDAYEAMQPSLAYFDQLHMYLVSLDA